MEKIVNLIKEFTTTEFKANKFKYDKSISELDREEINKAPKKYLHSILSHISFGGTPDDIDNDFAKMFASVISSDKYLIRTLFQIKKYENPTCGDVIKRILKENIIYLCYTSRDEQIDDNPLGYNNVYVVAETNEGLKIIDIILYHKGKVFITNDKDTSEVEHFGIKEYGKLMEVKKYQAPEEESSLKDYNSDN